MKTFFLAANSGGARKPELVHANMHVLALLALPSRLERGALLSIPHLSCAMFSYRMTSINGAAELRCELWHVELPQVRNPSGTQACFPALLRRPSPGGDCRELPGFTLAARAIATSLEAQNLSIWDTRTYSAALLRSTRWITLTKALRAIQPS